MAQLACEVRPRATKRAAQHYKVRLMMNNKLFVGNISFKMSEADLVELFSQSGRVVSVTIPMDRETGRKRGFAFVEMENDMEAQSAIEAFNGRSVQGRDIVVNQSRPRERQFTDGAARQVS